MPDTIFCDVLVLGGGPAGSAAALHLARRGYDVRVVDRAQFPRPKPCGEYLTPGAVAVLRDEIGALPAMLQKGATWLSEERIVNHGGGDFSGETRALACPRTVTDDVLLQTARAAGVAVHEGFAVRTILTEGDKVVGASGGDSATGETTTIRARVTVGADGTRSLLARTLHVVRPIPALQRIALVGHFTGLEEPFSANETGALVTMFLPRDRAADTCCGVGAACGPNRAANVNIVVPTSESSKMAGRTEAYYRETLARSFPEVAERYAQKGTLVGPVRSVGCFGHHTTRASHPGAVLVGDAATFIHPFTGEGVYFALRGAALAAAAIDRALAGSRENENRTLASYDAARRRELLPRYHLCRLVAFAVHSPALLAWATERLRRSPALTKTVLRAVGDVSRPADLLTPTSLRLLLAAL